MALKGHVFNKQIFSSDCFALFIDTFLAKHCGIVKGCELSNTANNIHINSGYFCIKGRFLQEDGGSTFEIEPTVETDLFCQLICEIDLSQENTTSELNQATYKILTSKKGYTDLLQQELTDGESIYQFEFARYKVTEQGVQEFQDTRVYLDFDSIYEKIDKDATAVLNQIKDELNQTKIDETEIFESWMSELQTILDENVAGNLLNLIQANSEAISNIEQNKADKKKTWNVSIPTTGWSASAPYWITIPVEGILSTDEPNMYLVKSTNAETRKAQQEAFNKISDTRTADNSITVYCDEEMIETAILVKLEVLY